MKYFIILPRPIQHNNHYMPAIKAELISLIGIVSCNLLIDLLKTSGNCSSIHVYITKTNSG